MNLPNLDVEEVHSLPLFVFKKNKKQNGICELWTILEDAEEKQT